MKEKKLYKIAFMGDKDHGCNIISTLESWGGSNYYTRTGNDPEYVYFINDLGSIDFIHNSEMLSNEMKNFYFVFWHDYNIECQLKVGESINYDGQDYNVDSILFDANNRCIVYKLKSFGIGVEYITNNELTPTEEWQTKEENNEYLCKNNMEKNLAIKGHPTRGKEVMELLEMMGGKNSNGFICSSSNRFYYILNGYFCLDYIDSEEINEYIIFTLEEFLDKYPFKVGDKVFLYDNITLGCVTGMKWDEETVKYCVYTSAECWCDVKDLLKWNTIDKEEEIKSKREYDELRMPLDDDDKLATEATIMGKRILPPDGYLVGKITRTDNGMLVEYVEKKPKYPTYEECKEMQDENVYYGFSALMTLQNLIICRNVYWKIAGEQMGLGKPWDSTYGCGEWGYWIGYDINENKICLQDSRILVNHTLVFPTEEMRDAFYENFKDLIEKCKELL